MGTKIQSAQTATKRGRPSKFTDALAREICDRLGKGEPLAAICRDQRMPNVRTVSNWTQDKPEFAASYACAREEGFDAIAIDCLYIADDNSKDRRVIEKNGQKFEIMDNDVIRRAKLRIETRLKLLAKWDPKRYGEKIDVNNHHTGEIVVEIGGDAE